MTLCRVSSTIFVSPPQPFDAAPCAKGITQTVMVEEQFSSFSQIPISGSLTKRMVATVNAVPFFVSFGACAIPEVLGQLDELLVSLGSSTETK